MNDIHVNQRLERESLSIDIERLTNQVVDLFPMVRLKFWPTKSLYNGHSTTEGVDQVFELSLNWVILESFLKSGNVLSVSV